MGNGLLVVGATLKCSHGTETGELKLPKPHGVCIRSRYLINEDDARYDDNIPNFGTCGLTDEPCSPEIIDEKWLFTESKWTVDGKPAVTTMACCLCARGGLIHPETTGQEDIFSTLWNQMDKAWLYFGLLRGIFCFDPVNVCTGNFVDQKTDLQISGSCPLVLKRTYNALDKRTGVMGKSWRHSFEVQLEDKKETIEVTWGDGRGEIFTFARTGRYTSGKAFITKIPKGPYELTTESGDTYTFNEAGKCTRIRDKNGNQTALCYEGSQLVSVGNLSGEFTFAFDEKGRVIAVSDSGGADGSLRVRQARDDVYSRQRFRRQNRVLL